MEKECRKCKVIKPITEFHVCKMHKGGYANFCKICRNLHNKSYYENNLKGIKKSPQYWSENHRRRKALLIDKFGRLRNEGCYLCGFDKYMSAMHLHHVNPKEKSMPKNKRMTQTEATKCVWICSNCHFAIHSKEFTKIPDEWWNE